MKVLIVDDELPARSRLTRLFETMDGYEVVGEAENGAEALHLLDTLQPEVVLMDIRMPVMTGLEAASHIASLTNPPAVIFATAYDQYALDAFEANAVDYLLKPIRKERLIAALEKANKVSKAQLEAMGEEQPQNLQRTHFWVRLGGDVELIPVSDVIFMRAEAKYVNIIHDGGETLIDEPLKKIEAEFDGRFLRLHRGTLVAMDRVKKMSRDNDGKVYVELHGTDEALEVSRRTMSRVRNALREYSSRVRKR